LKLAAEPGDLADLRRALMAMAADAASVPKKFVSTYFDTPDRSLQRDVSVLRVREKEGQFIQTFKNEGPDRTNPLERGEWEDTITDSHPDPDAPHSGAYLQPGIAAELHPLFVTEVERQAIVIEPQTGTRIEAAVDHGVVRAIGSGRCTPISEIELELREGDPASLYDVALKLLETSPLRIDLRSKSERGYRLVDADGAPPEAVSAPPVVLNPDLTVEDAVKRVGCACLSHMLRNEPAALAGGVEAIHQMRVAMRRLRSMLSAVKKILPETERRWVADELKVLTAPLGPARNLDVFATELLPPARDEAPEQPGWTELEKATEEARAEAHRRVKEEINSPRHTAAMLRLLRWFEARGWRREQTGAPEPALTAVIAEVAPAVLDRRRRSVRKRSRHFRRLPAHGRHRVRIAVKKLRYAIELVDSLYDRRDARPFINRLKRVQDELGRANDVRVAYGLVIELGRSAPLVEPVADAGAQMLAWHERALAKDEPSLRRNLRRLNRTRPFWRA
jgi:triphosphatase